MFYPFPYIKHIDQVREALAGREEFIISEKPYGFTVANYLVNFEDTFPPIKLDENGNYASKEDEMYAIRRECRGIKFDTKTGLVIARTLHKFFNINEKKETQVNKIFTSKDTLSSSSVSILEKLDGSMIHPILLNEAIRWCTKMGINDISKFAEEFAYKNTDYNRFAKHCIDINHTPIFEWCSRKQRIVLHYPEDRLVLIAVRENYSGRYLSMYEINKMLSVNSFKIQVVKEFSAYDFAPTGVEKDEELLDMIRDQEGSEGYVFRFSFSHILTNSRLDGHMLKAKSAWYLRIHKAKDCLSWEKDVIEAIVNEKIDDVKPYLMQSDLDHINEFQTAFWLGFQDSVHSLGKLYNEGKDLAGEDKKKFAIEYVNKQDPKFKSLLFQMWSGHSARDVLLDLVKKKLGSSTMVEEVRWIFNAHWDYSSQEE